MPVKLLLGLAEEKIVTITVCLLYLDTKFKEYTNHWTHAPRDRPQVRSAVGYRANDSFPGEWATSLNGYGSVESWLLLDRNTGRISQVKLPDFNSYYSDVSGIVITRPTGVWPTMAKSVSAMMAQITTRQAALQNHGRC